MNEKIFFCYILGWTIFFSENLLVTKVMEKDYQLAYTIPVF